MYQVPKQPTIKINCSECKSEHLARVKTTKTCNVCRAARDLLFIDTKIKKCFACDAKFAPVNRKDELCSECDYHHTMYGHGTCALCKAEDTDLMREDIAICIACMRDPKQRKLMTKAILIKKRERIKNPITGLVLPEQPPTKAEKRKTWLDSIPVI